MLLRMALVVAATSLWGMFATGQEPVENLPLRIEAGLVSGTLDPASKVRTFRGIPYAAPPVGDLRWRPPARVQEWTGVRQASAFAAPCMQAPRITPVPGQSAVAFEENLRIAGPVSEDCLYLNVWTGASSSGERRPVMVWIHGGGLTAGKSSFLVSEGSGLAKRGVVVVSFNYRLGAFGFLAHPALAKESPHDSSGNYGFLDQVAALQWVQRNIGVFGGDPENVTVFGQSAGAWSVSVLQASPLGKGLFRRAIGQSGAYMLGVGADPRSSFRLDPRAQAEQAGLKYAESVGARSLSDLRARSAEDIQRTANPADFVASIDGYVLPDDVQSTFVRGRQQDVPVLVGWNADEGASSPTLTAAEFRERLRRIFGARAEEVSKVYPADTDEAARRSDRAYTRDFRYGLQMREWARSQSRFGTAPAWVYFFDRVAPDATTRGAHHGAEITYAFNSLSLSARPFADADRQLSGLMAGYWTNFAATGDPNGKDLPTWPRYDERRENVMVLGDLVESRPVPNRPAFDLFDAYFRQPKN